jgi:hypothetical protein
MAKQSKYKPVTDGEWVRPVMSGYGLACCDCGLIHDVDFRVLDFAGQEMPGAYVEFRPVRNARATGQRRRRTGIEFSVKVSRK